MLQKKKKKQALPQNKKISPILRMNQSSIIPVKRVPPALLLSVSIFTALYWLTGKLLDVYAFTLTSVVYEILWLPMILLLFITPAAALFYWIKSGFRLKSMYLLSLTIAVPVLILVIIK
jgi:hypothetical protein